MLQIFNAPYITKYSYMQYNNILNAGSTAY